MDIVIMTGLEEGVYIKANTHGCSMTEILKVAIVRDAEGNIKSAIIKDKVPLIIDASNINFKNETDIAAMTEKRHQELDALKALHNNVLNQINEIENEL